MIYNHVSDFTIAAVGFAAGGVFGSVFCQATGHDVMTVLFVIAFVVAAAKLTRDISKGRSPV